MPPEIFAIRFFLGIFESPMLPAVVYYLSTFYRRGELASRIGIFYAAASIAGAFSGLIAYGGCCLVRSRRFKVDARAQVSSIFNIRGITPGRFVYPTG